MITGSRFILVCLALSLPVVAAELDFSGKLGIESQYFFRDAAHPGQFENANTSATLELETVVYWEEANLSLVLKPFGRVDEHDEERSHLDLREAYLEWIGDAWEVRVGLYKVFWGVTEFHHLVDLVNQTDLVEDINGEDKLGQQMIQLTLNPDWDYGSTSLFIMPGFRERRLQGEDGRFRFPLPYEHGDVVYESAAGKDRVDLALRHQMVIGDIDLGMSVFHGTSREPRFTLSSSGTRLVSNYDVIDQESIDLQYTHGEWLWKLEAFSRSGFERRFSAAAFGFEYTLVGLMGSVADLGLIAEYHVDDRDDFDAPVVLSEDLSLGMRIAPNDAAGTEILLGLTQSVEDDGWFASLEASRRIGESWKIALDARVFNDTGNRFPLLGFEDDDYIQLNLFYYF